MSGADSAQFVWFGASLALSLSVTETTITQRPHPSVGCPTEKMSRPTSLLFTHEEIQNVLLTVPAWRLLRHLKGARVIAGCHDLVAQIAEIWEASAPHWSVPTLGIGEEEKAWMWTVLYCCYLTVQPWAVLFLPFSAALVVFPPIILRKVHLLHKIIV